MFNEITTIVLGAGSSYEADLPIGEGLAKEISRRMDIIFKDGYSMIGRGDAEIYNTLKKTKTAYPVRSGTHQMQRLELRSSQLEGRCGTRPRLDGRRLIAA